MSVGHAVRRHVFLLTLAPLVILYGCASVHVTKCEQLSCATFPACASMGAAALEAGRPDEASCYFSRAVLLDPQDGAIRIPLGTSLLVLGKHKEAADSFRWVVDHDPDEGRRSLARDWLTGIDAPLPVAIFILSERTRQGVPCGGTSAIAARKLRKRLSPFGAFRIIEHKDTNFDAAGEPLCSLAKTLGARVALAVQVSCESLEHVTVPPGSGWDKWPHDESTVSVSVEVYQASSCMRRSSREKWAEASHFMPGDAIILAIDRAVSGLTLALATDLLVTDQ